MHNKLIIWLILHWFYIIPSTEHQWPKQQHCRTAYWVVEHQTSHLLVCLNSAHRVLQLNVDQGRLSEPNGVMLCRSLWTSRPHNTENTWCKHRLTRNNRAGGSFCREDSKTTDDWLCRKYFLRSLRRVNCVRPFFGAWICLWPNMCVLRTSQSSLFDVTVFTSIDISLNFAGDES